MRVVKEFCFEKIVMKYLLNEQTGQISIILLNNNEDSKASLISFSL